MTRFSKLMLDMDGKPVETEVREIKQADIMKCPFSIMVAEHYYPDGTCRCGDANHAMMAEWGYVWDDVINQWVDGEDGYTELLGSPDDATR